MAALMGCNGAAGAMTEDMRFVSTAILALLAASCGAPQSPPRAMGVDDNLDEARRHEADALRHEQIAREAEALGDGAYVCGDVVLADQAHSGTERIVSAPCWTNEKNVVERHLLEAERLRADARAHRARARELRDVEEASCATMPADERTHTPFAHREDIAAVAAELDGDRVVGARIRFHRVEGLTAAWLGTALACHRARAAVLGFDPDYMAYDPSVLANAVTEVIDEPAGVTVVIRAADDATALAVYGRAEDLVNGEP